MDQTQTCFQFWPQPRLNKSGDRMNETAIFLIVLALAAQAHTDHARQVDTLRAQAQSEPFHNLGNPTLLPCHPAHILPRLEPWRDEN